MSPLTPKQKAIYDYIISYSDTNGYPPVQQEIADRFGYRSLGTVQHYLKCLVEEGLLVKDWQARRGLKVLQPKSGAVELPLFGRVAAGKPIEAIANPDSIEVPPSMVGNGENFVLRVQGDSMIGDGILDGDYVVVRKQDQADTGQTVVALVNGAATVKRLVRRPNAIELHPANPVLQPLIIDKSTDFHIEGVVVGVIRHCR